MTQTGFGKASFMGNMCSLKRKTKLVLYWSCRLCTESMFRGLKSPSVSFNKHLINRVKQRIIVMIIFLVKLKQNFDFITVTLFLNVLKKK